MLRQRPDRDIELTPIYEGTFASPLGTVRFLRAENGRATALAVSQDRVWHIRFERKGGLAASLPHQ